MSTEKGNLSIHSENIFPIIKKWLYSDHDIFVRELVSNACDAITKVKRLSSLGETDLGGNDDFKVEVILDTKENTLKFVDNGIGMTAEEVKKYINQIAFSGAEDFIEQYKDKADQDQIIGHFGLGFYSAFMVAERVEINTLSHIEGSEPALWRCEGGTDYEMGAGSRSERGTEITLFLSEEGDEFKNAYKVRQTIEKYCSFMPFPVYFTDLRKEPEMDEEGNVIVEAPEALNETTPLYLKSPSSCTDEEYKAFYQKTFRDFKEPLFWIHLNMDYPFNLKGILYFPKLNTEFDTIEGQIKLYNSQVFVADNIKEVIPEFLLLLKGVIDCPDLPLNVSRSFLQNDGFVKKISDYITKKVGDKLSGMFKVERESYENFWDDISPFIKYGAIKDQKFYDKMKDALLFRTTEGKFMTVEDYKMAHVGKFENTVYYTTDENQQAQYIQMIKEHEVETVVLDHSIDNAFISHIEANGEELKFKRVDSDISDLMKEDVTVDEAVIEKVSGYFKRALNMEDLKVSVESLKTDEVPAMVVLSEESRRMQDMMKMYNMAGMDPNMFPKEETLILNQKNTLIKHIIEVEEESDTVDMVAKHVYDLAMLSHKPLTPEQMGDFIKRSHEILTKIL